MTDKHLEIADFIENLAITDKFIGMDDAEIERYIFTAEQILELFLDIPEDFKKSEKYVKLVGFETIYIVTSPMIFKDLFSEYEGLKKFGVEGAVNGEVWDIRPSWLGPYAKMIADAAGLDQIAQSGTTFRENFSVY